MHSNRNTDSTAIMDKGKKTVYVVKTKVYFKIAKFAFLQQ